VGAKAVRALLLHQGAGTRAGSFDLALDRHRTRRVALGHEQPRPRRDLLRRAAPLDGGPRMSTVFVGDDHPGGLKAIARLLSDTGGEVQTYASPREFLERHDRSAPGCLLLDLAMPGSSGLELQQALAAEGAERAVVFITGRGDIPTSVEAMKAGAVDFLTKPGDA